MIDKGVGNIVEEIKSYVGEGPSWEGFLEWFNFKSSSEISASDMILKFSSIVIPISVFMITLSGISFLIPNISDEKRRISKVMFISSILGLSFFLLFRLVIEYTGSGSTGI